MIIRHFNYSLNVHFDCGPKFSRNNIIKQILNIFNGHIYSYIF